MAYFSIIVPVYNVEKYLKECIESVLHQSFDDFELILVDDGAADGSPDICDYYAEQDNRVKAFHKKNGGASSARNLGMNNANGKYIIFLDGDDYWNDSDALNQLYKKASEKNYDAVLFGCTDWDMETDIKHISKSNYDIHFLENSSKNDMLHYLLSQKMLPGGPCIFCAKKSIIDKNNIRFIEGVSGEDYDYVLEFFISCEKISAIDNPFYIYRKGRSDSVTASSFIKIISGITYTIDKWFEKTNRFDNDILKKDILNYMAFMYSTTIIILGKTDKTDKKEAIKALKKYKYILKYGYWWQVKAIRLAVSVLGFKLSAALAKIYYTHFHN